MNREDYRKMIDEIDDKLVELFAQRMGVSAKIAEFKKENSLPVLDVRREREKLKAVVSEAPEELSEYTSLLYSMIFELSRNYQNKLIGAGSELADSISRAINETPKLFPERTSVACQGVEGAYAQIACDKLFKSANTL